MKVARMSLDFERLYEFRFQNISQQNRQAVWNVIAKHIFAQMGQPQVLLDPAAGRCEFANAISARECWVVDRMALVPAAEQANRLRVLTGDIQDVDLPQAYFDGVFVSNFLEHLATPMDVAQFLRQMWQALKPGGVIAIMGPNYKYCSKEYFDCADHLLPLTHVSVEEHLCVAGFEVTKVIPRFLPYSFRGNLSPIPLLVELYLKFSPAWKVLGKQFLMLARKS